MLVSHACPPQMRWQSRLFSDFDYLSYEPDDYIKDSDLLNRMILAEDGIKHELKNNVFNIIKEQDFSKALERAAGTKQPVLVLSGEDLDASLENFFEAPYLDLAIDIDTFTRAKRGNNSFEQKMYARFSFISKHKREIIDSGRRIWLLGFTQPHEVKRYGKEIYACVDNVVIKEAFWRSNLKDEFYSVLHDSYPEDPVVPLGVFESIRKFNDWAKA